MVPPWSGSRNLILIRFNASMGVHPSGPLPPGTDTRVTPFPAEACLLQPTVRPLNMVAQEHCHVFSLLATDFHNVLTQHRAIQAIFQAIQLEQNSSPPLSLPDVVPVAQESHAELFGVNRTQEDGSRRAQTLAKDKN